MERLLFMSLLLWVSCHSSDGNSSFPGLVAFETEALDLEIAQEHSHWIQVGGYRAFRRSALPYALGDITGDGVQDFAVERASSSEVVLAVCDGSSGEVLRTHPGSGRHPKSVVALPDLDGDGCADYLVRSKEGGGRRRREVVERVDLETVSGRTGRTIAHASWEGPGSAPKLQGVFTVVGEPERPLLLAFGLRTRPRSAFRRGPRNQVVESFAFLLEPTDLQPVRFLPWKDFPKTFPSPHLFVDWTGDGVCEWIAVGNGVLELRTTTSGERLPVRERRAQMPGYCDETSFALPVLLKDRVIYPGSGPSHIAAIGFRNAGLRYDHNLRLSAWPFNEIDRWVPVRDVDGDGVHDLLVASRGLPALPGRGEAQAPHIFTVISGAAGERLNTD